MMISQTIATGLISGICGFLAGFIIGKYTENKNLKSKTILTIMVAFVYVLSVLSEIIIATYATPVGLHGIMGLVTGYYFERSWFSKK